MARLCSLKEKKKKKEGAETKINTYTHTIKSSYFASIICPLGSKIQVIILTNN